jgi:hypothetical protein
MKDKLILTGKIGFDPANKGKKHNEQSSWKKVAMVFLPEDIFGYYSWFLNKRYSLILKKAEKPPHISFINDSIKDLSLNGSRTSKEIDEIWNDVKNKWDKKEIEVTIDLNPRTDDKYWWFNVPHEEREVLQGIRNELGLGKPYWGMHMTIGDADSTPITLEHSKYIHRLIKSGIIT